MDGWDEAGDWRVWSCKGVMALAQSYRHSTLVSRCLGKLTMHMVFWDSHSGLNVASVGNMSKWLPGARSSSVCRSLVCQMLINDN